jgi:hypothetical protein
LELGTHGTLPLVAATASNQAMGGGPVVNLQLQKAMEILGCFPFGNDPLSLMMDFHGFSI